MKPRDEPRHRGPTVLAALLLLLLLLARPIDAGSPPDEDAPLFEQTASNVSGYEGQTVYLPCRVHNLGDRVVSWMRSRDLHILTSGDLSFSSDPRFKPQHLAGSDAWTLRLDHLRKADAGGYECQVNTEPKIMYAVHLTVRELNQADGHDEPHSQQSRISYESTAPVATITGPRELRLPAGSSVTLRCLVTSPYQTRPLRAVQWLRDGRLLSFRAAHGGFSVETVSGLAQTLSEATLSNLAGRDSGKYSCRPVEGKPDSVSLLVHDAAAEAMQRDAHFASSAPTRRSLLCWLPLVASGLGLPSRLLSA